MGTLGIISLVMTGISTLIGVTTSVLSARAQAAAQEQQAEIQASSLKQQAEAEAQDQVQRSLAARRQNARRLAAAESQYAASGVSLQGTPTIALSSMARENELEVAMQERSSLSKRNVLLTDAQNILSAGSSSAGLTRTSGYINAGANLASGLGSIASDGYRFNKDGAFN